MKRILALDLGEKRVGVAISDPLKLFAQGLDVLHIRGKSDLIARLSKYFNSYEIEKVILGNPLNKEGRDTKLSQEIKKFAKMINSYYNVETILWDERFTTKEAQVHLKEIKLKKLNNSIDKVSAQLILQSYLERMRNERDS